MGLKTEQDLVNCRLNTDQNCLEFIPLYPFICTICVEGFYSNSEGICTKTNIYIDKCFVYEKEDTCQKCKPGFVLSENHSQCLSDL